jgi:hypothetical protein
MKRILFWTLAVIITAASAAYQRVTGPTYPMSGKALVGSETVRFRLPRSAENVRGCEIAVKVMNPGVTGHVSYKRFKTEDPWTKVKFERKGDTLVAGLPKQPAAGKLAYGVFLVTGNQQISITGQDPVIIRFKGPVPAAVIIIHVIVIFLSMLFGTMAGILALDKKSRPGRYVIRAAVLFFVGGFILGPIVQKLAFGVYWSGIPFGTDLTDNKTLLSMFAWIAALIAGRRGRPARGWVLAASVITLIINMIPHSLLGSELKYND